jgi:hypothetical protein
VASRHAAQFFEFSRLIQPKRLFGFFIVGNPGELGSKFAAMS